MNEKFVAKMHDEEVIGDTKTLADLIGIWCDGHHRDHTRRQVRTDGATLGIYGRTTPVLCEECEAHLSYAEKRRAYCREDPKPFCAYCEVHCYKPDEREWQREMMRYSGPRSWRKGHLLEGVKHMIDGRAFRKQQQARVRAAAEPVSADGTPTNQEDPS